ncbi:helix-turn-helix domain-containing protein [Halogeometricum sp. S1BR25-6]|uniref:Helix-turn-helix domain-containing protein n=1 Tax=Halogeometricum salsisoli TaxID=2950536 RepID=A0ABU2GM18_9EURY|nr:helix-turn-helix domain-containing protein [Halogeometricum sp. S1BR25-6]MDS0301333.1 helix-turn-helix domain-containing protein [Halogeometricum sp. S1BR25-6]
MLEFTLPSDSFPFGRATNGDPSVRVQLERLVPLRESRIPLLWATGTELTQFERHLRESEIVTYVEAVTRLGESVLYYVEWDTDKETFLNGLSEHNGSILDAHGDSEWSFTVRFRSHADLTRFHQFCRTHDYPVAIDRVYDPDEASRTEYNLGLTPGQREALMMAVQEGYFSVPRGTTLSEIADRLGITKQAASERVRRGAETVLRKALIGLVSDTLEPTDEA